MKYSKLVVAVLVFVPFGVLAQSIERPAPKVGDECHYDVFDNLHGKEKIAERDAVVTALDADRIIIKWTQKILVSRDTEDLEDGTWIYDKDLNVVQRNNRKFDPAYPARFYPLSPGAVKKDAKSTFPRFGGDGEVTTGLDAKVGEWEKITVPAGTFDALKITWQGFYNTTSVMKRWSGRVEQEIVLSPTTWCQVAGLFRNFKGKGGSWNDRTHVLTSFKN